MPKRFFKKNAKRRFKRKRPFSRRLKRFVQRVALGTCETKQFNLGATVGIPVVTTNTSSSSIVISGFTQGLTDIDYIGDEVNLRAIDIRANLWVEANDQVPGFGVLNATCWTRVLLLRQKKNTDIQEIDTYLNTGPISANPSTGVPHQIYEMCDILSHKQFITIYEQAGDGATTVFWASRSGLGAKTWKWKLKPQRKLKFPVGLTVGVPVNLQYWVYICALGSQTNTFGVNFVTNATLFYKDN